MLTIRLPLLGGQLTDIARDAVESITPKTVQIAYGTALQVEIAYHPADSSDTTKTMMLGQQFTVQPIDLANALLAWNAGAHDHPTELLDRIEAILRGRLTAGT